MGREVPFDVGIIDLGLPKMSGMELIKALRDEGKKFPGADPDRALQLAGQGRGLKQGCRRLPGEAVPCRGAAGPHQCAGPPRRRLEQTEPGMRTGDARPRRADGQRQQRQRRPHQLRVQGARVPDDARRRTGLEGRPHRAHLPAGLRSRPNVLEVFIGRLRKKLDPDGSLKPIETVRGRGYRFAIPRTSWGAR